MGNDKVALEGKAIVPVGEDAADPQVHGELVVVVKVVQHRLLQAHGAGRSTHILHLVI